MDTIENNKLIAEFMGLTIITDGISFFDTNYKVLKKYNSDWNDLMAVVNKIEQMDKGRFTVAITHSIICIYDNDTDESIEVKQNPLTKIEAVYQAVIKFINNKRA